MTHQMCDGCQRRLPKYLDMHVAEQEMFMRTANRYRLELEPKATDTWHKPEARKSSEAPFSGGGV